MLNRPRSIIRDLVVKTPLRRFSNAFHRYDYMFSPTQLAFLVDCVSKTEKVPGTILELGCATGKTTVYLNKHLDELGSTRPYVCVDTFCGFTAEDVKVEAEQRAKPKERLDGFRVNKKEWFDRNLRDNGISRVTSYEADINGFDLAGNVGPVSFCLLDVDLYRPVHAALEKLWPLMSPGGIIVVDDVRDNSLFDGAHQAYAEFAKARSLPLELVHGKLGVFRGS